MFQVIVHISISNKEHAACELKYLSAYEETNHETNLTNINSLYKSNSNILDNFPF